MKVYEVVSFWGDSDNTHGMYSTKKLAEDAVAALLDRYNNDIDLSIIEHVVDSPKSETIWRNWED